MQHGAFRNYEGHWENLWRLTGVYLLEKDKARASGVTAQERWRWTLNFPRDTPSLLFYKQLIYERTLFINFSNTSSPDFYLSRAFRTINATAFLQNSLFLCDVFSRPYFYFSTPTRIYNVRHHQPEIKWFFKERNLIYERNKLLFCFRLGLNID